MDYRKVLQMLIYCTGDSHTEGAGLYDKIAFPDDYPGDISVTDSIMPWSKRRAELCGANPLIFEKIRQENLKRSWAGKISDITGHTVVNGGIGGASILSMSMNLVYDIERLIKEGRTPDCVIIGLTTDARIPIINTHPIHGYTPTSITNAVPNNSLYIPKKFNNYCNEYWASHTDEEMLTFYLYHCVSMKNYVYARTGKYPIFANTIRVQKWKSIEQNTLIFLLKEYWNMLDMDNILSRRSLESFSDPMGIVLADGHFKENAHEGFAKYIADTYLNDR